MAKSHIDYDDRRLVINVQNVDDRVHERLTRLVERESVAGTAWMKENAPWTDRTSAARNGLHSTVVNQKGHYEIIFAHTVSYGIWLEVKYSGRDAIIMPTVQHTGAELMRNMRGLL